MASSDDLSDVELDTSTLLEKSRKLARKRHSKRVRFSLLAVSLLLNTVLLGLALFFLSKAHQPSYENGFASDLSESILLLLLWAAASF